VTETTHTRSRRASLGGLVIQLVAFAGVLALSLASQSAAMNRLAWYLLGGVPIWFIALLIFRQRELAALEALDLEELRRERRATGGGEALFGEEGGASLGFRVAELRLRWMQRWLVPNFGLCTALYLALAGIFLWRRLSVGRVIAGVELPGLRIGEEGWPALVDVPIAMVVLAIIMLGTFLYSRYASGMSRVPEWNLLRGCGSYMLGNALTALALLVALGVQQYGGVATWEQALAYILCAVMVILAAETLINFVLDIYRPRAPGVEPRACFDSRLLGLFAEPGGIASSIAEAMNYQFGFQVSQTWFYQLLQRWIVWLVLAGAIALLLLTCIVVVQPYEHVIIRRWGRQLNAAHPLDPGLHFKAPWPIDVADVYNTGQLHQINVGYRKWDATPVQSEATKLQLWTDEKHMGQEHFDFLTCPPQHETAEEEPPASEPAPTPALGGGTRESPVNLIRMDVAVQYSILPDQLDRYTAAMEDPEVALRNIAWEEVSRFNASSTVDSLLGRSNAEIGDVLRERISARVRNLGLAIVYVGVTNVHPEKTVAEAFRKVVTEEQKKVADIREALVTANERLSKVAGDAEQARVLANAVEQNRRANEQASAAEEALRTADAAALAAVSAKLKDLEPLIAARVDAEARLDWARERQHDAAQEFELGLGRTLAEQSEIAQAVTRAASELQAATDALEKAREPVRAAAAARLTPVQASAVFRLAEARVARTYWEDKLARGFNPARLEGEAAATLAAALAERWTKEMDAARQLIEMQNEREAYQAAPQVYKARRMLEVLVAGLKDARKYFLAFDPGNRTVRVRFLAEEELNLAPEEISPERKK
jgi:regulator of protease activity HflC (stomatin/prohibitin superfamily)